MECTCFFFTLKKCVEVVSLIIPNLQKWLQITTHSKLTKSSLNQTELFFHLIFWLGMSCKSCIAHQE